MRRLALMLAVVASFAIVPATPAQAHGVCSATATIHLLLAAGQQELDGSTFCSDVHVSTWVQITLHRAKTGDPLYLAQASCTDCRAVAIERFVSFPCSNGEKYLVKTTSWQRQDFHNLTSKWSSRVTCPTSG